jgi:hypothetical protein
MTKISCGGIAGRKRLNKIAGQFVHYTREMISSAAYRALSHQARKVLRRLEIEHMAHGGQDNGKLPCRYADFIEYGCRKHGIHAAIMEVEALGFVKTTSVGTRAYGDVKGKASTYLLTYFFTQDPPAPATNEWKKFESVEQARAAVAEALRAHNLWLDSALGSPRRRRQKKQKASPRNVGQPNPQNVGSKSESPAHETWVASLPPRRGSLSIFGDGIPDDVGGEDGSEGEAA